MIHWSEEMIREEIQRLDGITGLHGNDLPIRFTYSKRELGCFWENGDRAPDHFEFSWHFFHGVHFTKEEALDVIRHEYAHYMNCVLYHGNGHDRTWKLCCHQVGAHPNRYHTREFANAARFFETRERASRERSTFHVGQELLHETFGMGRIVAITPSASTQLITVDFNGTQKLFEAGWVEKNCAWM